ncbi:GNAT family N-acetyltransferase [Emcibacter nanhaiensis]|uniref:GNAT family N-acetyltransferase n=1 Tax=Emcibacter nanhaiensis TaxID=1505037 RepID=A0A501PNC9_9PROT|nr:GNAT family N-acetyltransferase [Emcibacter nanhaiensis]TPD61943.1 GNAT family N-acetyltransferase [Emcibacter nanhaiensis]
MTGAVLRPGTPGDIPTLLGFIRELADYEGELHKVEATEEGLRHHLFGPEPKSKTLIVELEGKPVGSVFYFYFFATYRGRPGIYLEDIYLQPGVRGRGIGKQIFRHLAREVKDSGGYFLRWWVENKNTSGIGFYEALGSRREKQHTIYHLEDESLERLLEE